MKKFTFLLLFILTASIGFAQNCTIPVSTPVFQNNFNQIAIQQTNQKKLEKANQFVGVNCLMSAQVKLIAQLFTEDAYRLEFCKLAYAHTYDQANFYDVYDAFAAFSFAFRLHDFIHPPANTAVVTQPVVTTPPAPTEPVYPNIAYPNSASYRGRRGCTGPVLNEGSFKLAAQNVFVQPTDESKQVAIQNIASSNCIDFAQLMKLVSMLRSENIRLQVMEFAYPKIFDLENYQPGIALFTNTQTQNQWTAYASGYLTPPPPPPPAPVVCSVTTSDFNGIMVSLKAKSFPADKLALIDMLSNDRCFSVEQIKTIGKEFSFGDDKLKVFKKLYAKCPDQNNYYKLADELSFSSEKDELNNFIKNGGK